MHRVERRQGGDPSTSLPSAILPNSNIPTANPPEGIVFASSTSSPTISTSPTTIASTSPTSTPSAAPEPPSTGLSPGIIAAIVVPIVIVALVAPIILYFCLTRHDRQQARSVPTSSRVSSRAYPDLHGLPNSRAGVTSPTIRSHNSEAERLKASEIMNFDLGPNIEKPLPLARGNGSLDSGHFRPSRPARPDMQSISEHDLETGGPIGQAVSRYSGTHDSLTIPEHLLHSKTSIQGLSEENVRIARLANDSQIRVSEISAPEERASRQVGARALDEISDVSSLHEYDEDNDSDTLAITDHGGNVLRHPSERKNGPAS